MRARCPHCNAETNVPAGTKAIVCRACYRAFTISDDARTLTGNFASCLDAIARIEAEIAGD